MARLIKLTGKINSDLTRKYPFKYFRGNRYITVIYDHDRNENPAKAIKNREVRFIFNAYKTLYNNIETKSLKPRFQNLYIEASNILIQILQDKNINFKLVQPNMHRHNTSERAIHTFNNHFIA